MEVTLVIALSARVTVHSKIDFRMARVVTAWKTDSSGEQLKAADVKSTIDGSVETLHTDGAFMAIGHESTSTLVDGVATDETGYILLNRTMTTVNGIFASGDVLNWLVSVFKCLNGIFASACLFNRLN